eukprot:g5484.t1
MVPLTEVAFMPGTIAGGSVMVGLGQDYYVERTPKEAQAVLQRRIADLSGQARVLEEGALLVPASPPPAPEKPPQKPRRKKKQGGSDSTMAWAKGFLSAGAERPSRRQTSPESGTAPAKGSEEKPPDDDPSATPIEIPYNDSEGQEHVVELEDGGEEPIMEIREWLDESGKQTSVDVTDLGKVLRTAPKAAKAASRSMVDAGTEKPGSTTAVATASPAKPNGGSESSSADLDSVFARLEEQEEKAKEDAASPALGPKWKKGFLDGAKRPARAPSVATPGAQETKQTAGASAVAGPRSDETARSKAKSSAFRGTVVEKPQAAGSLLEEKAPVAPARVSRFKARRQGL